MSAARHAAPPHRPAQGLVGALLRAGHGRPARVALAGVLGLGVVAAGTGAVTASSPVTDPFAAAVEEVEQTAAQRDAARLDQAKQSAAVVAAERAQEEAERLAREQAEREARDQAEREAREQAEREAEEARAAEQASRDALRDPRSVAAAMVAERGWSSEQMSCLDSLWTKESSWQWDADNPTSSAYGIPQALPGEKMASAGADWETNPRTQIAWGLGYIDAVYGTPCSAWSHSQSYNWY
ncbi:hypothetical protein [Pseudokineococcus sp. 1T1Z-3]|uniref:aggregation-promoting factor C-terminal-like domain-containing protein n=1 Tax=Pseudokineococcus sp. 1T1Z-3 TaxID=3132745 RepID=UPI0030AC29DC